MPLLRFGGFRKIWTRDFLGQNCDITTGRLDANAMVEGGQYRFYTCAKNYYHIDVYEFDTEALLISGNGAHVGYIHYYQGRFNAYQRTYVLYGFSENIKFIQYFLQKNLTKRILVEKKEGNTPYIVMGTLTQMEIAFPCVDEQKKIADCLSSMDELIAANTQKLESLKTHKKGLLQKLFPAEGELVPEVRFAEFHENTSWVRESLGDLVIRVGSGITPRGGQTHYQSFGRPFIRSQNVGWGRLLLDDVVYISEETHSTFTATELHIDDVLLNITGASIGRSAIVNEGIVGGNVNQHVCIIRTNPERLYSPFLNQFFLSYQGQHQIDSFQAGGNRQGLNFGQIRSFSICVPPNIIEQKKIANCLNSIDELIATQSKKVELLAEHKKGLMQQLFPTMEDSAL